MENNQRQGQLIKWQDDRGFGFIRPTDGSQEVFLHISQIKDAARRPQINDTIYYHTVVEKDGKIRAGNAYILGAKNKFNSESSFPVVEVLLLSILPLAGSIDFARKTTNLFPLILYPVMSLITFTLYADDKAHAKQGNRRIPEQTLHLCEFAGGWLGGFIAQRKFRHKTVKKSYQVAFWAIVSIHMVFWLNWFFLARR